MEMQIAGYKTKIQPTVLQLWCCCKAEIMLFQRVDRSGENGKWKKNQAPFDSLMFIYQKIYTLVTFFCIFIRLYLEDDQKTLSKLLSKFWIIFFIVDEKCLVCMWSLGILSVWFWSEILPKPIWDNHNILLRFFFSAVLSLVYPNRSKVPAL